MTAYFDKDLTNVRTKTYNIKSQHKINSHKP